jgi:hypothetical protein
MERNEEWLREQLQNGAVRVEDLQRLDSDRLTVVEWRTMQRALRNINGWTLYDGKNYYWSLSAHVQLAGREPQEAAKPQEQIGLSSDDSSKAFSKGYNDFKQGISLGNSILSTANETSEYLNRVRFGWKEAKRIGDSI